MVLPSSSTSFATMLWIQRCRCPHFVVRVVGLLSSTSWMWCQNWWRYMIMLETMSVIAGNMEWFLRSLTILEWSQWKNSWITWWLRNSNMMNLVSGRSSLFFRMENFIDFFLNVLWWLFLFLSHFCETWFWKWYETC